MLKKPSSSSEKSDLETLRGKRAARRLQKIHRHLLQPIVVQTTEESTP